MSESVPTGATPLVGLVMGSDSDWPVMEAAAEALEEFAVPYEADVVSAHRMPTEMVAYGQQAEDRGRCRFVLPRQPVVRPIDRQGVLNQIVGADAKEVDPTRELLGGQGRGAPDAEELRAEAEELSGKVEQLFRGETLRGVLLTSYGFSIFGERAAQAAMRQPLRFHPASHLVMPFIT